MDGHHFDELAKTLGRGGVTRRGALKALGGGLLGGLLGAGDRAPAGAHTCRAGGVLCLQDAHCCSGACDPATHRCAPTCRGGGHPCAGNQACCAGLVCVASGPGAALRCAAPATTTTTSTTTSTTTTSTTTSTPTTTTTAACLPALAPCAAGGAACCAGLSCVAQAAGTGACLQPCTTDADCPSGQTCQGGFCSGPAPQCLPATAPCAAGGPPCCAGLACTPQGSGLGACTPVTTPTTTTTSAPTTTTSTTAPPPPTTTTTTTTAPPTACGGSTCGACQACAGSACQDVCGPTHPGCRCPSGTACGTQGLCVGTPGCFVAGTRVALADGTAKPIEAVAVGDRVLGRGGPNRVLAVLRPTLGPRPLYALNGGAPFVTAGHPFLTEAGWKAVDPAAAAAEVPGLAVGRLAVGDRLLALAGVAVPAGAGSGAHEEVAVEVEGVALATLAAHAADPATPLYNLRVAGDHTYVADGWLVHNKLPR